MTTVLPNSLSNSKYDFIGVGGESSDFFKIKQKYIKAKEHYLTRPSLLVNVVDNYLNTLIKTGVSTKTVVQTVKVIRYLRNLGKSENIWWQEPLVNVSLDLEVVLEWWNKGKKLTIYVSEDTSDFIKVWGADIYNEMEDGCINSYASLKPLWMWISKNHLDSLKGNTHI